MVDNEKSGDFWKDVRAAATMGISDTAKLSDMKEAYEERCNIHEQSRAEYRDQIIRTNVKCGALYDALVRASREIINSRALELTKDGNLKAGWYTTGGHGGTDSEDTNFSSAGVGVGLSMGAAIGTPAAAWMMVGTFGAASTGTAISSLSGAASTTATLAWFGGGSVASGGLGMAAAPFVLSGIGGFASLPVYFVMGARAAGKKEEKYSERVSVFEKVISRAEDLMEQDRQRLEGLDRRVDEVTLQLIQDTTLFKFFSSRRDDSNVPTKKTIRLLNVLWLTIQKATEVIWEAKPPENPPKLYLGIPNPPEKVEAKPIDSATIEVSWVDGNETDEEVIEYEIWARQGRFGSFAKIASVPITVFRHNGLEPDALYQYQVAAVNSIGASDRSKTVSARTLPIN